MSKQKPFERASGRLENYLLRPLYRESLNPLKHKKLGIAQDFCTVLYLFEAVRYVL